MSPDIHEQRTLLPGSGGSADSGRDRTGRRRGGFGLPPELLQQARVRLRYLALLLSGVLVGVVVYVLLQRERPEFAGSWSVILGLYTTCLALSVALYAVARWAPWSHGRVLRVGLFYEVLQCLLISLGVQWRVWVETGSLPHVTWVSPIIILYPLVVPSPPRITLWTAVTAAATAPLSIAILQGVGYLPPDFLMYLDSSISPAASVVLAVFGSQVVYGLSRDVARARELGSYRLEAPLGEGGMGTVWRASHRLLARPAAIKMISPEALGDSRDDPDVLVRRFRREAQATAALCSAHTINLFDFGVADDGMLYYVMEYLDGIDMEHLVDTHGPLPPGRTVHFLRQICHSLAEAHDNGLIHRDIKPANLYVCRYGREIDHVKVLDFGLVKAQDDGFLTDVELTVHDLAGGTPAFMAPEQILGNRDLDGRTDIYSLGCVAYWLLTGRLLFDSSTPMELMIDHSRTAPQRPSQRTEIPVPEDLEGLVMTCLAKDPDDRPVSVEALDEALRPLQDRHPWGRSEALEWWRMHRPLEGLDGAGIPSGPGRAGHEVDGSPSFRKRS